ncbi:hypothetical protein I3843_09G106700 [Carya illinoinensis]|uniref:Uncharacterized protein n=1 Tax=Carya illinoinensis TaxID=32201 RepID=A0A922J719_CARIL|nr:hypothetical protein I3842_09G106300 [Carya illinoinensis]KAG7963189.1 hypothetical protein I3843_09G106700 [Carya illinoinensis]
MAQKIQQQLKEVGSKLETPPSTKDALVRLLKQAATCLAEFDQSPSASILESMQPFLNSIVKPEMLKHQDRDVKLLVATCICEITRITAPEAPYGDDVLKDIFHLIVSTFSGLSDTSGPSFSRRVVILETLAKYRSCVVMLDLECDDLVNEMFTTFFSVASDDHPESILSSMQTIMVVLLEESEDVREDLLFVILSILGRNRSDVTTAARRLAMNIIEQCAVKLEAGIKQFLISSISGDSQLVNSHIDYHEVIYDIYRCAPQILFGVVPYLTGELLTDQLDTRLKAVKLVGDLFALPSAAISEAFQPIFSEFLKRLTDRVVEVRVCVLEHVKSCLLSDPLRAEAPQVISALCDRLLDFDENVRQQVVAVICDVACHTLNAIPLETVKLVAERLRDKSLLVKKYTMERLAEIYKVYSVKFSDRSINPDDFDWIPGKILRCFYDKDFRSDIIESVLCGSLFPTESSIKDKVQHWVRVFSGFDKVEVKALEKILEQKQRVQQEMQRYLSLRQMNQDGDVPEIQKKVIFCFRIMSRSFADPAKAEENYQILDQLKDANIWKILTNLVDPNTSFNQACTSRILARFSPLLLGGAEGELVNFLKDDDEIIKEGVLHVLAKAGGTIREQLASSSSSIDLILERLCLEGSRRQAKYAVHALAAITKDDGLKSLSVLYKRLVDMLEEKTHLPAVLQSLGCIAETAMPVFETRDSEIEDFIIKKILQCSNKEADDTKASWDDRSELCLLKIFGIKTLVKSYLPVKDAHVRPGIDGLLNILRNILSLGEISKDVESSLVDKAHLRLASAKAVLRLSKYWDERIPVDIFHLTLMTSEISFPQAKKLFLGKVHQYIKDRHLDAKYACAFLFNIIGSKPPELEEEKQNLADIIQMYHQTKSRQSSMQSDGNSLTAYPEYILPYFVHALAHHSCPDIDECKDVKAFELIYRQLHLIISMLLHGDEDAKAEASTNKEKEIESISVIVSIFQSIKCSADIVDAAKSKDSHAICDLGILIAKRLAPKEDDLQQGLNMLIPMPSMLYKLYEKKEGDDSVASVGQTWLADENILTHFESLKLEADEEVFSEVAQDEELKHSEIDGNELPLGKMIKRIKSQGTKAKKVKKNKSSPAEAKNAENDVDILKMVREINYDNLGMSSKFESSNGHEYSPGKKTKTDLKHEKGKKRKASDTTSIKVPKRPRSSSAHGGFRSPASTSKTPLRDSGDASHKAEIYSFQSIETDPDISPDTKGKISSLKKMAKGTESDLVSSIRKKLSFSAKLKGKFPDRDHDDELNELGEANESDMEKPMVLMETDKIDTSNVKSPTGSSRKRKRRSIAGLAKCTSKAGGWDIEDLIGCRIKVWWPMDKRFYQGTVKSYDPSKRKHVVLYDDGDVEVLRLEKERWELIDHGRKSSKKINSSNGPPSKEVSPRKKSKNSGGLHLTKGSIKTVKGKRTPKRNLKRGQKDISKSDLGEAEDKGHSDILNPEPTTTSKADEMNSGDSEGEHTERLDENLTDKEESEKEVKSVSKTKRLEDAEESPHHTDESDGEEIPDFEGRSAEDIGSVPQDSKTGDEENSCSEDKEADESSSAEKEGEGANEDGKSDSEGSQETNRSIPTKQGKPQMKSSNPSRVRHEVSDDEPLMKWKHRAGKRGSRRLG